MYRPEARRVNSNPCLTHRTAFQQTLSPTSQSLVYRPQRLRLSSYHIRLQEKHKDPRRRVPGHPPPTCLCCHHRLFIPARLAAGGSYV